MEIKTLWNLYEAAVQDPAHTVNVVDTIYQRIFKRAPNSLREDFCGTFAVGREWTKRSRGRRALGVDNAVEVVDEAGRRNRKLLSTEEQRRASVVCKDVRAVTDRKSDVVLAENFSFFVFKTRGELLEYFKACYQSLAENGMMALDLAGGELFVSAPSKERKTKRVKRRGVPKKFTYIRRQESYDPATAHGLQTISFKVGKRRIRNAFTYDWRIWTLPEVRECLLEAGFDDVKIFWDDEKAKLSIREISSIENKWTQWVCVIVGVKSGSR